MFDIQRFVSPYKDDPTKQGRGYIIGMNGPTGQFLSFHGIWNQGSSFKGISQELVDPHYSCHTASRTGTHTTSRVDLPGEYQVETLVAAECYQQGTCSHTGNVFFRVQG